MLADGLLIRGVWPPPRLSNYVNEVFMDCQPQDPFAWLHHGRAVLVFFYDPLFISMMLGQDL